VLLPLLLASARTRQPLRLGSQPSRANLVTDRFVHDGGSTGADGWLAGWLLRRRGSRVVIQWDFFHRDLEGEVNSTVVSYSV
jgi:hypothetical protein